MSVELLNNICLIMFAVGAVAFAMGILMAGMEPDEIAGGIMFCAGFLAMVLGGGTAGYLWMWQHWNHSKIVGITVTTLVVIGSVIFALIKRDAKMRKLRQEQEAIQQAEVERLFDERVDQMRRDRKERTRAHEERVRQNRERNLKLSDFNKESTYSRSDSNYSEFSEYSDYSRGVEYSESYYPKPASMPKKS